jgi:uncharacterized protein (DUF736 family)
MSKMTKTGAGWKKTSRGGHEFVSCTIDLPDGKKMRLTMWANKYKEKPNQPDFNFYLADERVREKDVASEQEAVAGDYLDALAVGFDFHFAPDTHKSVHGGKAIIISHDSFSNGSTSCCRCHSG